jgi:restriction endonuclease Mrr
VIPTQAEIEIPLLEALGELGGEARPKDVYPLVTAKFGQLTEEDLAATLNYGAKKFNKWTNRIQWVRLALITAGEMASPRRGVWAITEKGRLRLQHERRGDAEAGKHTVSASVSLVDLMIEKEFGVQKKPLQIYEDQLDTIFGEPK